LYTTSPFALRSPPASTILLRISDTFSLRCLVHKMWVACLLFFFNKIYTFYNKNIIYREISNIFYKLQWLLRSLQWKLERDQKYSLSGDCKRKFNQKES
jgi:hypothetical protein